MAAAHNSPAVSPWQKVRTILRAVGLAIGILLLVMEGADALVTPKPDWFWFAAAALLIFVCRPERMRAKGVRSR